jgi:hypothetical protein
MVVDDGYARNSRDSPCRCCSVPGSKVDHSDSYEVGCVCLLK